MTNLKEKLKEIQQERFYLAMKDHWEIDDYSEDNALALEEKALEEAIKEEEEKR